VQYEFGKSFSQYCDALTILSRGWGQASSQSLVDVDMSWIDVDAQPPVLAGNAGDVESERSLAHSGSGAL
jgi:hypothetical protein